jgi:hypothetical protein
MFKLKKVGGYYSMMVPSKGTSYTFTSIYTMFAIMNFYLTIKNDKKRNETIHAFLVTTTF